MMCHLRIIWVENALIMKFNVKVRKNTNQPFFVNVNTFTVNKVEYCRKKENGYLEEEWPFC